MEQRGLLRGETSRSNVTLQSQEDQPQEEPGGDAAQEYGAEDRRGLRVGYRSLQTSLHGTVNQELVDGNFKGLVGQMEDLHSKVSKPREQVADAETLLDITHALLDNVKFVKREVKCTPDQFLRSLVTKFSGDGGTLDWVAICEDAGCVLPEAAGFSTMLGPMDIQPKVRKVTERRRTTQKTTEVSRPEEVKETPADEINQEVERNIMEMFGILRAKKRVKLEHLLLNRLSFAQTVENLFAFSFLVKDGRAEIKVGESDGVFVVPKNAPSAERRKADNIVNKQFVFRFDFADWKFMQGQVQPGEELMKHRSFKDPISTTRKRPIEANEVPKSSKRATNASNKGACDDDPKKLASKESEPAPRMYKGTNDNVASSPLKRGPSDEDDRPRKRAKLISTISQVGPSGRRSSDEEPEAGGSSPRGRSSSNHGTIGRREGVTTPNPAGDASRENEDDVVVRSGSGTRRRRRYSVVS